MDLPFLTQKDIEARVLRSGKGEALIVAFRSNVQPGVCRIDLSTQGDFIIQIVEQDNAFVLGLAAPAKPFYPMAQFVARAEAEEALQIVRAAMVRGVKQTRRGSFFFGAFIGIVLFVLAAWIFGAGGQTKPDSLSSFGAVTSAEAPKPTPLTRRAGVPMNSASGGSVAEPAAEPVEGVPVLADEALQPPKD